MDEFLQTVADTMNRVGLRAEVDAGNLVVDGVKFPADDVKRRKGGKEAVKFLGAVYVRDNDGHFSVNRAIAKVIGTLPEMKRRQRERAALTANAAAIEAMAIGRPEMQQQNWFPVAQDRAIAPGGDGIYVRFRVDDLDAAKRLLGVEAPQLKAV